MQVVALSAAFRALTVSLWHCRDAPGSFETLGTADYRRGVTSQKAWYIHQSRILRLPLEYCVTKSRHFFPPWAFVHPGMFKIHFNIILWTFYLGNFHNVFIPSVKCLDSVPLHNAPIQLPSGPLTVTQLNWSLIITTCPQLRSPPDRLNQLCLLSERDLICGFLNESGFAPLPPRAKH